MSKIGFLVTGLKKVMWLIQVLLLTSMKQASFFYNFVTFLFVFISLSIEAENNNKKKKKRWNSQI